MAISRRSFLIGATAAAGLVVVGAAGGGLLVENGVIPGKSALDEVLGRCGDGLAPPDVEPGPVTSGTFTSAARNGAEVGWSVLYPPGSGPGDTLAVCLFLHGRGGSHTDAAGPMELPRFLAGAVDDGSVAPFAIASVDGGDAVNWHPRADGDDPAANSLWARRDLLGPIPLRIDCGESDPFVDRVREFRDSLDPVPAGGIEPGCHDGRFWSRQTPDELAFVGTALASSRANP